MHARRGLLVPLFFVSCDNLAGSSLDAAKYLKTINEEQSPPAPDHRNLLQIRDSRAGWHKLAPPPNYRSQCLAAPPSHPSRRRTLSAAGHRSAWLDHRCRRPKTCTKAAIRLAEITWAVGAALIVAKPSEQSYTDTVGQLAHPSQITPPSQR
jgi:hypothetical protein